MDEYNVKVLSPARIDILDMVEHMNTLPPELAQQRYDQFVEQIETLKDSPERYPLAKDAQLRLRGYRTYQIGDYTLLFVIKGGTVEIRRVLFSKLHYERLL